MTGSGLSFYRHQGGNPTATRNPPEDMSKKHNGRTATVEDIPGPINMPNGNTNQHNNQNDHISCNTRVNIMLATLNMKECSLFLLDLSLISKWNKVHSLIKTHYIGILALQETYLSKAQVTEIYHVYRRYLKVFNSSPSTNSVGIAFVLNKEITNYLHMNFHIIILGQMIALTIKWHQGKVIILINIYVPNGHDVHLMFWEEIRTQMDSTSLHPDILLEDFNIVEEPIDQALAQSDNENATNSLRDFCATYNL